jgi:hypothetical protein
MGFIKEPKGIDFVIDSGTLSDNDRAEISLYIKEYKLKTTERKLSKNNKSSVRCRNGKKTTSLKTS